MKKFASLISAAVMSLSAVSMNASAALTFEDSDKLIEMCDVTDFNLDGVADFLDVYLIMRYYAMWVNSPEEVSSLMENSEILKYVAENGDIYEDGVVDSGDAAVLIHYCAANFEYGKHTYDYDNEVANNAEHALSAYAGALLKNEEVSMTHYFELMEVPDVNGDGITDQNDATIICIEYDTAKEYFISYQNGDIDQDGTVTAMDAGLALKYYGIVQTGENPMEKLTAEEVAAMKFLGDFDMSGDINASDASAIIKEYAKNQTNR